MKAHAVFLRQGCSLPPLLHLPQIEVCKEWMQIEELDAASFDKVIHQTGWHFFWIQASFTRRGYGTSRQRAIDRALGHALSGVAIRFNAAELGSVDVQQVLGIHIATVKVFTRQVKHHTALDYSTDA